MYKQYINIFSFQTFKYLNKLCINDTLLSLYILSSSILTIWFLFYLSYFIFFKISKNINKLSIMAHLVISFYFFTKTNNFNLVSLWLITQNINITLQNGLLNIHPIYIYIIYAYIYIIWFCNYKFYNTFIFRVVKISNIFSILCVIVSGVYLGSFWASQELNWGGFWSWDPVELISLFLLFWFLFLFHNINSNITNKPTNHIIITAIIIYFIIRLGVINTIHSFIRTNSKPFFSQICIILISFVIVLNKKKYYYNYSTKYMNISKIYIIILFISCFYLCVYIFSLISFINSLYPSPIYFYFILITMGIYIIHIKNKIEFYKYFINIIIILIFNFFFKINNTIILLSLLFLYNLLGFKKVQMHIIILIGYFLFFIFFININIYNSTFTNLNNYNINLNLLNSSAVTSNFYEIFFFLKKNIYLVKIKNFITHISGFSILTNTISSLFLFSKNKNVYYLFTLEIIYLFIFYLIIISVFMVINYKFLDNKYFYKSFNIKKY